MGLFTILIFQDLLNLKKDCNTYKINDAKYTKCIKLQKLSSEIFEKLQSDYFQEFEQLKLLQENEKFQQYLQTLEYFHTLIDSNIDNYIATTEQEQILKDIFYNNIIDIVDNDCFLPV